MWEFHPIVWIRGLPGSKYKMSKIMSALEDFFVLKEQKGILDRQLLLPHFVAQSSVLISIFVTTKEDIKEIFYGMISSTIILNGQL